MQQPGHLRNFVFENAHRVGVGDHQGCNALVDFALEFGQINHSLVVGFHLPHFITGNGRGSWVCSMGGIRNEDGFAWISL